MENDKTFELISKMYEEMQEGFRDLKKDISDLKVGQDKIDDRLNELEGTKAANHIAINSKIDKVSDDLDFLTHKEFQTEKEIFNLRKKLPKQKINSK